MTGLTQASKTNDPEKPQVTDEAVLSREHLSGNIGGEAISGISGQDLAREETHEKFAAQTDFGEGVVF